MTQHSQNGEGVEASIRQKIIDQIGEDYDRVILKRPEWEVICQSLAREPATADVGREDIARIIAPNAWCCYDATLAPFIENRGAQEGESWHVRAYQAGCRNADDARRWWLETADSIEPYTIAEFRISLTKADRILAALSRAAPSSGHAMAEGERVAKAWSVMMREFAHVFGSIGEGYYPEVTEMREAVASLATTPPMTNDAIPAGMVRWDGGDRAPDDWDGGRVLFRHGHTSTSRPGEGMDWRHFTGVVTDGNTDIIAYTPKPSPTPKGGLPGRGEVEADTVARMSVMSLGLVAYITGLSEDLRWTPEFTRYVSNRADEITALRRTIGQPLAPAEAIRDGGEGGGGSMSLYQSSYEPRGVRKDWERTSVGNDDAEQAIRRRFALKPDVRITDAVSWWREDCSLAVLVADLTNGRRAIMRQSKRGSLMIDFEVLS